MTRPAHPRLFVIAWTLLCLLPLAARAADWPQYRADAARSGYTADRLPEDLSLTWVYHAPHAPIPAWPRSDRLPFDRALEPVVAGGSLYFGDSVTGKIFAVDAATGDTRWTFYTGGPVRFAPVVWRDRVLAGSDDGYLYCLDAADGRLVYRLRGGPDDRLILGNERMISRWPVRGGPVLVDDVVYFGAGIWPSDGIYLYAIDPASGEQLWLDEESGGLYMPQPHGGANAKSGVSAQGYLAATGERLLVPTGRAVPAVFRRDEHKLEYFHLQEYTRSGGAPITVAGDVFFNLSLPFDINTGKLLKALRPGPVAVAPEGILHAAAGRVTAHTVSQTEKPDRRGNPELVKELVPQWTVEGVHAGTSLVAAENAIISTGGNQLSRIDPSAREQTWTAEVDGTAYGLAIAGGRLYVSTDQGTIYCFTGDDKPPSHLHTEPNPEPYGGNDEYAAAARAIVEASGVTDGYCLDLGCADGALAYELAQQTDLFIVAIESNPGQVIEARERLDTAGLLGTRVMVIQGDLESSPLPAYFADLVVSARSVTGGVDTISADEVERLTRPEGGIACLGSPENLRKTVRGPLENVGKWTHQYADAGNTLCSTDDVVKGTLEMLWFRDIDHPMPQRHGRGPAPLYQDGRLFVEGLDGLCCVSAYNGHVLWRYPLEGILEAYDADHLMGTAGTGSNYCLGDRSVYVRVDDRCLRLDQATGQLIAELTAPSRRDGQRGTWGYIAYADGTLFGSLADEDHVVGWRWRAGDMSRQFTESKRLFALDPESGSVKWSYDAEHSIRHNTLAIGDGRLYLIDRPQAEGDRLNAPDEKAPHPPGKLVTLDTATGEVLHSTDDDVFGTLLAVSAEHDALLMSYQPTRFRLNSERGGRLAVYRASTGERLWTKEAKYESRPILNERTIYAQGGAWDLLTGDERPFNFSRSYGCGILAGSKHLMLFRSATLGYFDLNENDQIANYGGMRPGCWINALPVGGLVLVPDASAGCECSYLNKAWMALKPREAL